MWWVTLLKSVFNYECICPQPFDFGHEAGHSCLAFCFFEAFFFASTAVVISKETARMEKNTFFIFNILC